jgi:hypothetical protein
LNETYSDAEEEEEEEEEVIEVEKISFVAVFSPAHIRTLRTEISQMILERCLRSRIRDDIEKRFFSETKWIRFL